jgi:photosystem II stability/assembly factor-like uncharacterized protein
MGVSFCNDRVGWAVGSGLILHTVNSGESWEIQRPYNKDETLFSIACLSPERAWVVGTDGLILQTKDGGKTWSQQDSGTKLNLVRVRFFGSDGWITGGMAGKGILLRTRNGGESWETAPLETSVPLLDIYVSGLQGWIVGAEGTILQSNDGGQAWQQQKSPTDNDLTSLFFLNPMNCTLD